MESKCCKPTSAPQTPGQCSVTTACSKHWKQQGFAQFSRSMPRRMRRMRWGGGRLCWEASGQEAAYQVLLKGPRKAQEVPSTRGHSFRQLWRPLHQVRVPCDWVSWVHASGHAASCSSTSSSTSTSTRFWSADSRREQSALGSNQHLRLDSYGVPWNTSVFFGSQCTWSKGPTCQHYVHFLGSISRGYPAFQGDIQSCLKRKGNWGMRAPGVRRYVPVRE